VRTLKVRSSNLLIIVTNSTNECIDAIGFYFYRRERPLAALSYCQKACDLFDERDDVDGVGQTLLHIAAVHSLLGKFQLSHQVCILGDY
jgi:hypothetical protein